jgi:hypothetical protein
MLSRVNGTHEKFGRKLMRWELAAGTLIAAASIAICLSGLCDGELWRCGL